ncbi:cell division protein FtsQ/DivIB [Apilactobacillus quenuiae]|uniref:cell division protein FtsQ/DivIB n=1 Tax=Apilactobacillus quenuiae TaxID=2008377 RepID=UPI000D01AB60|nr:FtsQ-type POTRA domain-containing protein [Apilactobacillus quenuiae]
MKDFLQNYFNKIKNSIINFFKNSSFKSHIDKSSKHMVNKFNINSNNFDTDKIKKNIKKSLLLFTPLLFFILIISYFISPLSKIDSIKINGNGYISKSHIAKKINIEKGDSVFKVIGHRKQLTNNLLSEDHRIKSISFSLSYFNRLVVNVNPYKKIGYETKKSGQYLILENGNVSNKPVNNPNGNKYPYIVNFNNRENLKIIINNYLNLPKDIRDNIRVVSYSPTKIYPDELHVYMRDGNRIILLLSNFSYKMQFYRSIATKLKSRSVINMEVGAYSYPIKK